MATIRASCPDCGDVEFTTRDVQVRVSRSPFGLPEDPAELAYIVRKTYPADTITQMARYLADATGHDLLPRRDRRRKGKP